MKGPQRATARPFSFSDLSSLNAEAFYAAMGLVRIAMRAIAMGPGPAFPVIVMEADLPIA